MSVYAWADLHGRMDLFQEGLKHLTPEDTVYFLGDAADRGPDGWEIMKAILANSKFIYLKGNHEDLMVNALRSNSPWGREVQLWYMNGGQITHTAFLKNNLSYIARDFFINKLDELPFVCVYHNAQHQDVILSHSGYDDFDNGNEHDFIWDRTHWEYSDIWYGKDNEIIVHGHTPIELMIEEQARFKVWPGQGSYWYAQGHKCNIDTGAVWNNNTVLLNLDTWEDTIITCDK